MHKPFVVMVRLLPSLALIILTSLSGTVRAQQADTTRPGPVTVYMPFVTVGDSGTVRSAAVDPLVLASGPSVFAACTIGGTSTSTNYPNAEVEPWVDINPTDATNLIAVWQQDRWSDGGAHGLATAVTHDGGATWQMVTPPAFSQCASGTAANGGDYERASDPWVTFAPNGHAYQISLSFNATSNVSAILVSKSADGGNNWSLPTTLIRDSGERDSTYAFNDKEAITADPTNANYVYAVWDRFVTPGGTSFASLSGYIHSRAFRQPIWFARTTDGGQTWEPARKIYDRSSFNGTLGSQIVVLPNGDLVNIFDEFFIVKNAQGRRGINIALIRSTDKGTNWSRKSILVGEDLSLGAVNPDTGVRIRAEGGIPDVAVNRTNGTLYAVWQDARFSGVDGVAFASSSDGGFTWSTPMKVNRTPVNSGNPLNQQAFVPSVHVADNGVIGLTYYDFRNNTTAAGALTDYWIIQCNPALSNCNDAANWQEQQLSTVSFDIEQAPAARGPFGFFVGDYEGLTSTGNSFRPLFVQVNNGNMGNRTDVFTTSVTP